MVMVMSREFSLSMTGRGEAGGTMSFAAFLQDLGLSNFLPFSPAIYLYL